MDDSRFNMNAFLITVMIFSAIVLFVTVTVTNMADTSIDNECYQIEETGYYVRYATLIPSGIYDDPGQEPNLMIAGSYGHDWGVAVYDNVLYANEYHSTKLGYMICDIVKIDLSSFEKEILYHDAMLNGKTQSGELIIYEGTVMPNWFADTNSFASLYEMTSGGQNYRNTAALVKIVDPVTKEILYEKDDLIALTNKRTLYYRNHTAEEIRK